MEDATAAVVPLEVSTADTANITPSRDLPSVNATTDRNG